MKTNTFFATLMLVLFCAQATVLRADELGPLYDGTNSAGSSIPVEGNNIDRYQKVQIIYPKADLTALAGKNITKMTFYLKTKAAKEWNAPIQIRLTETDANQFTTTDFLTANDWTVVYTGTNLSGKGDLMEVTFTNSFAYSGEKNLLFELQVTGTTGSYSSATFYAKGGYDPYYSIYKYATSGTSEGISTGTRKNVIPKTLFTYEEGAAATCEKPANVEAKEVAAKSATLTWAKAEAANWQYICLKADAELDWTNATATTDTFAVVDGLTPETAYKFYVRRFCSAEDQSKEVAVAFTTEKSCFAPTTLGVVEAEITSGSAKVTWAASGKGETQWQYTYEVWDDETPDWTNAVVTDQTEATISNLNPATPYQVWVRSYCAADDQSAAETTFFTTKCTAFAVDAENPWKENFDKQELNYVPLCWEDVQAEASSYYFSVKVSKSISYSSLSSNALVIDNNNAGYGYVKFPEFTAELNTLQIAFSHTDESESNSGTIDLGYFAGEQFTLIKAYSPAATKKVEDAQSLASVPAGARLAIRYKSNSSYNYAVSIDDIELSTIPTCLVPAALAVSEVTDSSAKIAWESEAETYAMQLSTDGLEFADINGVITNPYVLNGLEEQTQYWVRVKAICDESLESEWTEAVAFTTPCAAKAFGYAENFDGENLAACWENKDVHGMNEWSAYENTARYATTSNIANHATLVSPWITIEAESNPVLFFDWQNTGATAKLSIEANGEAATELQDLSEPTGESFASFRLYLTEYKGKTVRFLFYGESSAKSKYLYLDNFQVVEKPLLPPTDLKAEAVEGGASVTWKAAWDEVSWAIQVKATAAEDWTAVNAVILEPAYTLTGLDDETEYEVQVQAIYGENQVSAWTESAVFTTPAKTPTAVENAAVKNTATKRIVNGQLLIELNGEIFNAQGVSVK